MINNMTSCTVFQEGGHDLHIIQVQNLPNFFKEISAKFYEMLHGDRYLIPEVILKCLKHKIDNSKERLAINLEMKKSSDMDPDDWNIAWRFYGKMISHLCAFCLTLCVSVASFLVIISSSRLKALLSENVNPDNSNPPLSIQNSS